MKNIVLTSDKRNWLLRGFMHQWRKYCGLPITIAGYTKPDLDFKNDADFYRIGNFSDYPADKWSNALIKVLKDCQDEQVLIMLEDYWLTRYVNTKIVFFGEEVMKSFPAALRFDITTDRLYCGKFRHLFYASDFDIIEAEWTDYHLSFQASIWNKSRLLDLLLPNETPWQTELLGTGRAKVAPDAYRVLGTRQWPMSYCIMVQNGVFSKDGSWMYPPRNLSESDYNELEALEYTHE